MESEKKTTAGPVAEPTNTWEFEYCLRSTCKTHTRQYEATGFYDAYDKLWADVDEDDVSWVKHSIKNPEENHHHD